MFNLYDLDNDPHELMNMFHDPEAAGIRAKLEGYVESRPNDTVPDGTPVGTA